jgi:hypothetical protein
MQSIIEYEKLVIETFVIVSTGITCYLLASLFINLLIKLYILLKSCVSYILSIKIVTIPDIIANTVIPLDQEDEELYYENNREADNEVDDEVDNDEISNIELYRRINELQQYVNENQKKYHTMVYRMNLQLGRILRERQI